MSRRYQRRTRSCASLILAALLLVVVLVELGISRRPRPTPPPATPTPSPTLFAGRMAVAALPTNTPYLALTPLPSFTPTPSQTPTPTTTPTRTPTPVPTFVAQVNTALANLRGGPGVAYPTLAILGEGEEVVLKGQSEAGDWLVVESANGNLGWIAADLLSETPGRERLTVLTPPPTPTPPPATATPTPAPPTPTRPPIALAAAAPGSSRVPRLVLANYFVWYDAGGWGDCNISAGDRPLTPYSSDDPEAIARQVQMAIGAGIDGFTSQWIAPGERTDRNFATLLSRSQGTGFQSTVVFQRHYWAGTNPTQASTAEAIRYLLDQYGGHPNFLKINGRPVIFFTDVGRAPRGGGSAQDAWAAIRAQADPGRASWWMAEGLDPSFLTVFDGLWLYNVTHASSPNDYVKAPRWAQNVRAWEQRTGQPKLWVATLMPGSDDSRARCKQDVRAPAPPRVRAREDGNFYRATYNAAIGSNPDLLWINSFNEWVEGTYIEPSQFYGDAYLNLTRELAAHFKGQ
jgi:hypothetical protein